MRASGVDKKPEKEKQRSDREESGSGPAREEKEESKGESPDEEGAEWVEVKVEKGLTRVEVVGEVLGGNGLLPVGEDQTGYPGAMDKQPKAETTEKAGTGDDTARCPGEAKSPRLPGSNKSSKDSAKSLKKSWSLKITKRPPLEQIPVQIPSRKCTEDVAGPRFGKLKEPEGRRCAGDYPPVYEDGFVSSIQSSSVYLS